MDLLISDRISLKSRFSDLSFLGNGNYGMVLRAKDKKQNQKVVALKFFFVDQRHDIPFFLIREMAALKALPSHPHLISLLDVFVIDGQKEKEQDKSVSSFVPPDKQVADFVLVLEYLSETLESWAKTFEQKKEPIPEELLQTIQAQCVTALKHLHNHHFIHRDIKPDNILLAKVPDGSIHIKLCDFGLCKSTNQNTFEISTPHMFAICLRSPSLLCGSKIYLPSDDFWALEQVFYQLRTGEYILSENLEHLILQTKQKKKDKETKQEEQQEDDHYPLTFVSCLAFVYGEKTLRHQLAQKSDLKEKVDLLLGLLPALHEDIQRYLLPIKKRLVLASLNGFEKL